MALFVNQENERTELQKRLAAELAEKAKRKSLADDMKPPKDLDDSNYLRGTKQTTSLAWVWIVIIIAFIGAIIFLIVQ